MCVRCRSTVLPFHPPERNVDPVPRWTGPPSRALEHDCMTARLCEPLGQQAISSVRDQRQGTNVWSRSEVRDRRTLRETTRKRRVISIALTAQQKSGKADEKLKEAENAIRNEDWNAAINVLRDAVGIDPTNPLPRMKLGILLKDRGMWEEALEQFEHAVRVSPQYGEAFREKGIAENKLAQKNKQQLETRPAPGETSLRRAIELNAFAAHGQTSRCRRSVRDLDRRKTIAHDAARNRFRKQLPPPDE
jgi:Flp pilus assembly protein TadD